MKYFITLLYVEYRWYVIQWIRVRNFSSKKFGYITLNGSFGVNCVFISSGKLTSSHKLTKKLVPHWIKSHGFHTDKFVEKILSFQANSLNENKYISVFSCYKTIYQYIEQYKLFKKIIFYIIYNII